MKSIIDTHPSRRKHMCFKGMNKDSSPHCNKPSHPGTVTQRSCVYGGARVVLMPITDAIHLVHGPIGCAACTWDIRGSKSSNSDLYKTGFSTDLQEKDIVFGGENKLLNTIVELCQLYNPVAIFVYSTCVAGVIGDDIKSVCKKANKKTGYKIVPVQSEGFRGVNKSLGHQLACDALLDHIIGKNVISGNGYYGKPKHKFNDDYSYTINIVGEFNVAGDLWAIKPLLESIGVKIISSITGDSCIADIANAHHAKLNIVQCQKSSNYLAKKMEELYGIPHIKVNFFGVDETKESLRSIARFFGDDEMIKRVEKLIDSEISKIKPEINIFKQKLAGKKVSVYVGGNKAWSLIRAFEELKMEVIMTGTQNGLPEDYDIIKNTVKNGTLIVDDANAIELTKLLKKYKPDLMVSGAKEKYLAMKLGIPFCDFNHDRIVSFAGFRGFFNFAREVDKAVSSPVWDLVSNKLKKPTRGLSDG